MGVGAVGRQRQAGKRCPWAAVTTGSCGRCVCSGSLGLTEPGGAGWGRTAPPGSPCCQSALELPEGTSSHGGSLRLLLSLVSVMEGVPSAEGGVPCAGPPLPDSQRSGLLQQPGCHPPALVQVLWQTININRISPRGPGKELCCLYEEGRLPHQPTSPRPHSFQGSYNKGFDGAQRHVAALHV